MSNQDDFNDAPEDSDFDTDLDADFEEFDQDKTLGDLWKNPAVKMGTVLGGFLVVVGSILLFGGGDDDQTRDSRVSSAPEVKQTPGTAKVSQNYEQAVREKNKEVLREAERQGRSAIPVPVDPTKESMPAEQEQQSEQQDPLERWRNLQQQRADTETQEQDEQQQQQQQQVNKQRQKQLRQIRQERANTVNNLAKSMSKQMENIMNAQALKGMRQVRVASTKNKLQKGQGAAGANRQQRQLGQGQSGQQQSTSAETLLQAGTIEYGQLLIEANSDTEGPIMAEISTGPFKGARLIGSFETRQERYLTMRFDTMAHEDETYSINAVALDPNTTLSGMATEVDRRYLRRVVLPAAAGFIEGFGEAIAQTGSTTTNTGTGSTVTQTDDLDTEQELAKGFEKGTQEIGDLLDEEADQIKPLIRVAAGTPMGIFFTQPVTSQSANNGAVTTGAGNALQQSGRGNNNQQSLSGRAGERLQETGNEQLEETGDDALDQLDFLQQLQNQ